MIVRCGRCQSSFDVAGPGRVQCPVCGTTNEVRAAAPEDPGGLLAPPPPPAPEQPSPRAECQDCGFEFIVGPVEEAPCPNCGTPVTVATGGEGDA